MSSISVFLLDNSNNFKSKTSMKKPSTYKELINQIKSEFKDMAKNYEIFIIDKQKNDIKINSEEKYKLINDEVIYIRELDKKSFKLSVFGNNFKKLTQSKKQKLEEKFSCILCCTFIKNENPYFCYNCQNIYHEKCLKDWDNKCKSQNKILSCPNCRKELPIEQWKKKLNFDENRNDVANLMNKINEYRNDKNLRKNINVLNDNKINEYKKFMEDTKDIFKAILDKLNSLHILLKLSSNKNLNDLINKYPNNSENLDLKNLSKIINEELEQIIFNLKNNKKLNIYQRIITNNQTGKNNNNIEKRNSMPLIHEINDKNTLIQFNKDKNKNNNISSGKNKEELNDNKNINNIDFKKHTSNFQLNYIDHDVIEFENNNNQALTLKYFVRKKGNYNIFGKEFVQNNKEFIDLIINGKNNPLIDKYELTEGENSITMIMKDNLTNLSYMFSFCDSLRDIKDLKNLNVEYVIDFSYMFCGCASISDFSALQNWNVSRGYNFASMFCNCTKLVDLTPLERWDVSSGIYFQYMFYGCSKLIDLNPLMNWNVSNGVNFVSMFSGCSPNLDTQALTDYWQASKEKTCILI